MKQQEVLINWLNDAYATEQNGMAMLTSHIKDAEGHPEIQTRLKAHFEQCKQHAQLVADCIRSLGGKTSSAKSVLGKVSGFVSGVSTSMFDDELVKNCLADISMEHFEIASYRGLIVGAEALGETSIAETCRRILCDEEEMASFLEARLPAVTQEYIAHAAVA